MATWIEGKRSISYNVVWRIKNGKGKAKGLRREAQLFHHGQSQEGKDRGGKPSVSEGGSRQQRANLCWSEIFTAPTGKLGKPTSSAHGGQRKGGRQNKLISVCEELRYKVIGMLYKERR